MNIEELIVKNRSYRRFVQSVSIPRQTLVELVNIGRRTPSSGNRQPLRYILVHEPVKCAELFAHLRWAAALKGWGGPAQGERPAAYLIILTDTQISESPECDAGIAAQSMLLAATEKGIGGCMLGAIDRPKISQGFNIPERYKIILVLALGVPAEKCVLEDTPPGGDITYYRDAQDVHHVPKRPLEEILLGG